MNPDSFATDDSPVDVHPEDDQDLMAQTLGFSSFGGQPHPNKKRRYNPRADASGVARPQKPSATGANSTALGPGPSTGPNADEIALDDDGDDVVPAPAQVRPASLPQRPAAPPGGFAASHQPHSQPRRHHDHHSGSNWYEGYYDPSSNENPWERAEKARGMSPVGSWLPRGGAPRASTTGAPA